ncbi:siderophore-interacting protein [Agromyces atrinae]|uniref:NADPH-dependent ferric siderophore reductase n=1 Tax=Agromyces atrinae TaxID=592376 RepID=A0A4Q2M3Q9_9MICO|nr:siderophore-interacting protein [Agromyces atrinae]NYD66320.1 NADPH-dependent ferric siderophore reductase [Agromyces atrinae]RXZ86644.1 siderophore-interacting protein [Agromyces atrinae]
MSRSFSDSPNVLFRAFVATVRRVSTGFVRVTLRGDDLAELVPRGLDQRIKLLLPQGRYPDELRHAFLAESDWRSRWRSVPLSERPAMRSYTIGEARPESRELDIDFYVHARPGPGSAWALRAAVGDELLLSAPDRRLEQGTHGVQWAPGAARHVLIAGDETAFPAIAGIVRSLAGDARTDVAIETGHADDAELVTRWSPQAVVVERGDRRGGEALLEHVTEWAATHGSTAAAAGADFYAWCATESARVAEIRDVLARSGIDSDRIHVQGYWHDRERAGLA